MASKTDTEDKIVNKVVKRLEESLGEAIIDSIVPKLQALIKEEFKQLHKEHSEIEKHVFQVDESLADDRKDLGHIKSTMATVEQQGKELIDINNRQTKTIVSKVSVELENIEDRVTDKVSEKVPQKAKEAMRDYIEVTKPKVIQVIEKVSKNPFKFWKRG